MPLATKAELAEIAAELRAMAAAAENDAVKEILTRVADRYAAMAASCGDEAREVKKSTSIDLCHGLLPRRDVECASSRDLPGTFLRS